MGFITSTKIAQMENNSYHIITYDDKHYIEILIEQIQSKEVITTNVYVSTSQIPPIHFPKVEKKPLDNKKVQYKSIQQPKSKNARRHQ